MRQLLNILRNKTKTKTNPKALLYPVRLHSRVCTTNFSSEPEAQTKSGLGTLHGQHFILPLNVTLAIRSHLPRRWETVFRWTMKAIIGPRRSGEPLYSKREKTWWSPWVLMILMSASRDHPQTSFSTRAPWRFAFDHKSINSSEHARCARSSRQPMVCSARRPIRAGGWVDGWAPPPARGCCSLQDQGFLFHWGKIMKSSCGRWKQMGCPFNTHLPFKPKSF